MAKVTQRVLRYGQFLKITEYAFLLLKTMLRTWFEFLKYFHSTKRLHRGWKFFSPFSTFEVKWRMSTSLALANEMCAKVTLGKNLRPGCNSLHSLPSSVVVVDMCVKMKPFRVPESLWQTEHPMMTCNGQVAWTESIHCVTWLRSDGCYCNKTAYTH